MNFVTTEKDASSFLTLQITLTSEITIILPFISLLSGFSFPKKPELYYFGHDIGGILSCYWTKFDQVST